MNEPVFRAPIEIKENDILYVEQSIKGCRLTEIVRDNKTIWTGKSIGVEKIGIPTVKKRKTSRIIAAFLMAFVALIIIILVVLNIIIVIKSIFGG